MGLDQKSVQLLQSQTLPIKTLHSTIDPDSIAEFARQRYALPHPLRCRFFLRGTNDIYRISAGDETYYIRINRHAYRTHSAISSELEILDVLGKMGQRIAKPIRDTSGNLYQIVHAPEGERILAIFEAAKGETDNKPQPIRLQEVGKSLSSLHCNLEHIEIPTTLPSYDLNYCIHDSVNNITKFLHSDPEIRKLSIFYQSLATKLRSEFRNHDLSLLRKGGIHGDFQFGNFVFDENGKPTMYDFDRMGYGWLLFDIATYLGHLTCHSSTSNPRELFATISKHFLNGYEQQIQIPSDQKSLFPLLYLLRRLHMRALCCIQYVDWSNQFLSQSNWHRDVAKNRAWARTFCGIEI